MTKEDLLIIFTRNPVLGKVKTRLAASIGAQSALEIYIRLLRHTEEECSKLNLPKHLYYTDSIGENDLWDSTGYQKFIQEGSDLGERMHNAFLKGFELGYKRICLIGSDLFELEQNHITAAFEALKSHRYVLGPAHDGGYYLIGMSHLSSDLFENKEWGTSSVLKDTLNDLDNQKVFLLEELNDIDTFEDLQAYPLLMELVDTK